MALKPLRGSGEQHRFNLSTLPSSARRYSPFAAVLIGVLGVLLLRPPLAITSDAQDAALRPSPIVQGLSGDPAGTSFGGSPNPSAAGFLPGGSAIPPLTDDESEFDEPPSGPGGDAPEGPAIGQLPELPSELDPILAVGSPLSGEACNVAGTVQALAALAVALGAGVPGLPPGTVPPEALPLLVSGGALALQVCGLLPVPVTNTDCPADEQILAAGVGIEGLVELQLVSGLIDTIYALEYLPGLGGGPALLILAPMLSDLLGCVPAEGP